MPMEWVLILSALRPETFAIDHIDGFDTQAQAEEAGNVWTAKMRQHGGARRST